jgi:hypothetical protein
MNKYIIIGSCSNANRKAAFSLKPLADRVNFPPTEQASPTYIKSQCTTQFPKSLFCSQAHLHLQSHLIHLNHPHQYESTRGFGFKDCIYEPYIYTPAPFKEPSYYNILYTIYATPCLLIHSSSCDAYQIRIAQCQRPQCSFFLLHNRVRVSTFISIVSSSSFSFQSPSFQILSACYKLVSGRSYCITLCLHRSTISICP